MTSVSHESILQINSEEDIPFLDRPSFHRGYAKTLEFLERNDYISKLNPPKQALICDVC